MVEFIQSYGLWIALFGVFVAMHWFGMGCCGGRQRQEQGQGQRNGDVAAGKPGTEKASESAPRSDGGCH